MTLDKTVHYLIVLRENGVPFQPEIRNAIQSAIELIEEGKILKSKMKEFLKNIKLVEEDK